MISVVLLTRNRKDALERCLKSLEQQTYRDFEVVVVDNGSTDGTAEMLRHFTGCRIRQVEHREAGSFAESRNRGLDAAQGEIVAFVDDDCRAEQHWLERIDRELRKADAIGGLALPRGELRFPRWWHSELGWLVGLSVPGMLRVSEERLGRGGRYYAQTANMAIRRELLMRERFQEIGGDLRSERRRYYAGREDAELWRRLRIKGYHVYLVPDLIVYHHIGHERLRLSYVLGRAYSDGLAYYLREQKRQYLPFACYDVVALPVRILEELIRCLLLEVRKSLVCVAKDKERGASRDALRQSQLEGTRSRPGRDEPLLWPTEARGILPLVALNLIWGVRQAGVLAGYVRSGARLRRSISVVAEIGRQLLRHAADTAKRPVRRTAVAGYRTFWVRRQAAIPLPIKSILIVACGYLGDMVILQPSVRLLARCLPETSLTLLAYPQGAELYGDGGPASAGQRIFSEILVCPPEQWGTWEQRRRLIARQLGSRKFSAIVIAYYHHAPSEPLFLSARVPTVAYDRDVGFRRQLWYEVVSHSVEKNMEFNEILNSVRLLEPLGVKGEPEPYEFVIPEEVEARMGERLAADEIESSRLVVISPGARWPAKQWPEEAWARLAQMLEAEWRGASAAQVVFTSEQALAPRLDAMINRYTLRSKNYPTSLVELGALIRRARLLITPDSGAKHLAFALGTPTVTLYGASDERRWGALWERDKHLAVRACPFDLSGEELMGLPVNYQMRCITPELVMQHADKLL